MPGATVIPSLRGPPAKYTLGEEGTISARGLHVIGDLPQGRRSPHPPALSVPLDIHSNAQKLHPRPVYLSWMSTATDPLPPCPRSTFHHCPPSSGLYAKFPHTLHGLVSLSPDLSIRIERLSANPNPLITGCARSALPMSPAIVDRSPRHKACPIIPHGSPTPPPEVLPHKGER